MSGSPTVSVLIPCRNAERYLEATLESAESQTLQPVEILVVDDGSTDASRAIAERHRPAVTLLTNPGQGVSAARNHASAVAQGEFFQYLDADDLLLPHALRSRVSALVESDADVAISDWQRIYERGGRWEPGPPETGRVPNSGEPADLAVFQRFWVPPAAILYRRSLCERIGGWRETLPVIQDARFLFDAARLHGRFVHVASVGALYRQHTQNSLSSTQSPRFWRDVLTNAREVERLWSEGHELDAAHRTAIAAAYAHCAHVGFSQDRELFEAGCAELRRFPEYVPSRRVRAATTLTKVTGYAFARLMLSTFLPAGQP